MVSLATTERQLGRLVFRRRYTQGSKIKNISNQRRTLTSGNQPFPLLNRPRVPAGFKIKSFEQSLKFSSFNPPRKIIVPVYNPNKPTDVEQTPKPIVPLMCSRFPARSEPVPSVTKVLGATMSAEAQYVLDRWRQSMIKKLGIAGFNQYTKDTFERGRALHALVAKYLMGQGEPTDCNVALTNEVVSNLWKSINKVVREKISNVRLVEHVVTHKDLNYRGVIDCVAFYEDELVVIDFKTAEKPKKDLSALYDNPLQVSAYCGALNNDMSIPDHVIDRNVLAGVVIVAYIDGSEASTFYLDRKSIAGPYWKEWTTRLDQYGRLEKYVASSESKESKKENKASK